VSNLATGAAAFFDSLSVMEIHEEIHLWTFDDSGKVAGLRHYTDTAKHIKAAKGSLAGVG
jgi:hypothetical protein